MKFCLFQCNTLEFKNLIDIFGRYQGVDGDLFVQAFGNGQFRTMSPWDFQTLLGELTTALLHTEASLGQQEWRCGETKDGYVKELVCGPCTSTGESGGVVTLTRPVRPWEAVILVEQAIPRIRTNRSQNAAVVKLSMKSSEIVKI